ncbi:chitinase [Flavobacteriaceae bacterium UJ101]|nr:chitinase [Flavobacteriaceae bacterium UJ101]
MKKKRTFIKWWGILFSSFLIAQVGIGNNTPNGVLDLTNSTSNSKTNPLVLPSMSGTNAEDHVVNPKSGKKVVAGSIFYDLTEKCLKVYDGTTWNCISVIPPIISTLDCASKTITGNLTESTAASGVSFKVPYTGGNGSSYSAQTISSTGVTGLTASLASGNFNSGNGNLTFTISGTPSTSGSANFNITVGGKSCTVSIPVSVAPTFALDCSNITVPNNVKANEQISGFVRIPYSNATSITYPVKSYTPLAASTSKGTLFLYHATGTLNKNGTFSVEIGGTPDKAGNAFFEIEIGGETCLINVPVSGPTAASVTTLNCSGRTTTGTLTESTTASSVSFNIPYTGGNGGAYNAQTIKSTGVTGLTASLTAGNIKSGNGSLTFTISGTPSASGNASFAISVGGKNCTVTIPVNQLTASVTNLNCSSRTLTGSLTEGTSSSGVSFKVPYVGGNGGTYNAQTISSTEVTGLTASLTAGNVNSGNGNLTFTISGTPSGSGNANFKINIGGKSCSVSIPVTSSISLNCSKIINIVDLTEGVKDDTSSFTIPYTGGNGKTYKAQTVNSTSVTGLTASLKAGTFSSGNGNLTFTISGTPNAAGNAIFNINIEGKTCSVSLPVKSKSIRGLYVGNAKNFNYNTPMRSLMSDEEKAQYPVSNTKTSLLSFWGGKAEFAIAARYHTKLASVTDPTKYVYSSYRFTGKIDKYKLTLRDTSHNLNDYGISVTNTTPGRPIDEAKLTITVSNYTKFKNKVGLNGEIILSGKINQYDDSSGIARETETTVYIRLEEVHFRP